MGAFRVFFVFLLSLLFASFTCDAGPVARNTFRSVIDQFIENGTAADIITDALVVALKDTRTPLDNVKYDVGASAPQAVVSVEMNDVSSEIPETGLQLKAAAERLAKMEAKQKLVSIEILKVSDGDQRPKKVRKVRRRKLVTKGSLRLNVTHARPIQAPSTTTERSTRANFVDSTETPTSEVFSASTETSASEVPSTSPDVATNKVFSTSTEIPSSEAPSTTTETPLTTTEIPRTTGTLFTLARRESSAEPNTMSETLPAASTVLTTSTTLAPSELPTTTELPTSTDRVIDVSVTAESAVPTDQSSRAETEIADLRNLVSDVGTSSPNPSPSTEPSTTANAQEQERTTTQGFHANKINVENEVLAAATNEQPSFTTEMPFTMEVKTLKVVSPTGDAHEVKVVSNARRLSDVDLSHVHVYPKVPLLNGKSQVAVDIGGLRYGQTPRRIKFKVPKGSETNIFAPRGYSLLRGEPTASASHDEFTFVREQTTVPASTSTTETSIDITTESPATTTAQEIVPSPAAPTTEPSDVKPNSEESATTAESQKIATEPSKISSEATTDVKSLFSASTDFTNFVDANTEVSVATSITAIESSTEPVRASTQAPDLLKDSDLPLGENFQAVIDSEKPAAVNSEESVVENNKQPPVPEEVRKPEHVTEVWASSAARDFAASTESGEAATEPQRSESFTKSLPKEAVTSAPWEATTVSAESSQSTEIPTEVEQTTSRQDSTTVKSTTTTTTEIVTEQPITLAETDGLRSQIRDEPRAESPSEDSGEVTGKPSQPSVHTAAQEKHEQRFESLHRQHSVEESIASAPPQKTTETTSPVQSVPSDVPQAVPESVPTSGAVTETARHEQIGSNSAVDAEQQTSDDRSDEQEPGIQKPPRNVATKPATEPDASKSDERVEAKEELIEPQHFPELHRPEAVNPPASEFSTATPAREEIPTSEELTTPARGEIHTNEDLTTPAPEEIHTNEDLTTPASKTIDTSEQQTTPASEEIDTSSEQTTPASESVDTIVPQTTPAPEGIDTSNEQSTPAPAEINTSYEQTTSASVEINSSEEQSTSAPILSIATEAADVNPHIPAEFRTNDAEKPLTAAREIPLIIPGPVESVSRSPPTRSPHRMVVLDRMNVPVLPFGGNRFAELGLEKSHDGSMKMVINDVMAIIREQDMTTSGEDEYRSDKSREHSAEVGDDPTNPPPILSQTKSDAPKSIVTEVPRVGTTNKVVMPDAPTIIMQIPVNSPQAKFALRRIPGHINVPSVYEILDPERKTPTRTAPQIENGRAIVTLPLLPLRALPPIQQNYYRYNNRITNNRQFTTPQPFYPQEVYPQQFQTNFPQNYERLFPQSYPTQQGNIFYINSRSRSR